MRRRRTFRRRRNKRRRKYNQATLPRHAFAKLRVGWHFTWIHGHRTHSTNTLSNNNDTSGDWTPAAISWPTVDVYKPYFITKQTGGANGYCNVFGGLGTGEWLKSNLESASFGNSVTFHQRQPRGWDRIMMYYRYYKPTAASLSLRIRPCGSEEIDKVILHSSGYGGVNIGNTADAAKAMMNDTPYRILWCTRKFAHRAGESNWAASTGDHDDTKSRVPFEKPLKNLFWNQLRRQHGVRERRLHPWEDQNHSVKIRWYAKQPYKHPRFGSNPDSDHNAGLYETMWNPTDKPWNAVHQDSATNMWGSEGDENVAKRNTPWFHLYVIPETDTEEITAAVAEPVTPETRKIQHHPICVRVDGVQTFYVKLAKPYRMMDDRVYTKPVLVVDEDGDEQMDVGEDAQQGGER